MKTKSNFKLKWKIGICYVGLLLRTVLDSSKNLKYEFNIFSKMDWYDIFIIPKIGYNQAYISKVTKGLKRRVE